MLHPQLRQCLVRSKLPYTWSLVFTTGDRQDSLYHLAAVRPDIPAVPLSFAYKRPPVSENRVTQCDNVYQNLRFFLTASRFSS